MAKRYVMKNTDVGRYWGKADGDLVGDVERAKVFTTAQIHKLIINGDATWADQALEVELVPRLVPQEGDGG